MLYSATPDNLTSLMQLVEPGDVIELGSGRYCGIVATRAPGQPDAPITVRPAPGADVALVGGNSTVATLVVDRPYWVFDGLTIQPEAAATNTKPAWIAVRAAGMGAVLRNLRADRPGPIEDAKRWNDYGIVFEADDVHIENCQIAGMVKGLHPKGRCKRATIINNEIGPTYQSCIAVGTSFGDVRGMLIGWNILWKSYIEDGVQFMQNPNATDSETDISNLGTILYRNRIERNNENGVDLKGAGFIILDGNLIAYSAGSNDGPLNGWNFNAVAAVTRGARSSCSDILLRNSRIERNASGIRLLPRNWKIIHNLIGDNNWRPERDDYEGFGIRQPGGAAGAVAMNNIVGGHKAGNLVGLSGIRAQNNPELGGALADPLTFTLNEDHSDAVRLDDVGFFTDWFGRTDLPRDVVYIGGQRAEVLSVDRPSRTLVLDRRVKWVKGAPVFLGYAQPLVGPLGWSDPRPPEEPDGETDPPAPDMESVTLTGPPASVAALRNMVRLFSQLQIGD